MALNFAELSSHFPVAGSVYQWTKYLAGRGYAWFTGWFYIIAGILTVASVCATLPLALLPMLNQMFGWHLNTDLGSADQALVAIVTLVLITVLNIYGVKVVAIVNNTGVFFEILGMVVFAIILAVAHNNQGVGVIFEGRQDREHLPVPRAVQHVVLPGGDVHEPVRHLRVRHRVHARGGDAQPPAGGAEGGARRRDRGVRHRRRSSCGALLIAIPDMGEAVAGFASPPVIISEVLSTALSSIYLFVVSAAIFVCCMSILTSTIRLAFGMARDDQLPFSKTMAKVSPRLHTPVATCIIIGLLSAIPFIQFSGPTVIAVGATASIYLSYLLGNFAVMRARMRGWPKTKAPFSLGKWGKLVNVVAIVWGLAMLLNFLTPSSASSAFDPNASGANYLRIFSNPKPIQTDYYVEGEQLVDFKIDFLNKIPLIWTVFALVLIIGAIYYFAVQRKKPYEAVHPPDEEDLAGIAPA